MPDARTLVFASYQFDRGREQLRRGGDVIPLTNKAFAVLRYLVEHAEQLITRDALLEAVWPGTFVSDAALTVCIHELRQALGEKAQAPQFIETVRGRGYRFLAPVTAPVPAPTRHGALAASSSQSALSHPQSVGLVGREAELLQLHQGFVTALQGERQVVFITGEAGIGKTTLVEAFLAQIAHDERVWIGYGQCIDQYGAGEAYLPILEALGRLCRGSEGRALVEFLWQAAPSWLLQMPALLSADEFDALQRRSGGATQERMLRELAEALELLTAERPFVLVLEDLHWSDGATLDWLTAVARRRDRARLLVLGTYRPVETIVQAHPLRTVVQELKRHSQCWELLVDYLSEAGVAAYVRQQFGASDLPEGFPRVLHQRTNGNPLFMRALVEDMMQQGVLEKSPQGWGLRDALDSVAMEVPESLRQLIEDQLAHLRPEEQDILEAASVAGIDFSTAAVAAGVDATEEEVERCCAALCRRKQFLQVQGTTEWPDGTVAARYGFIHALYQEVLYNRVSVGRRVRLHGRIGTRLEMGYGAQAREIAAELAMHCVRGRDAQRASQYLWEAGENALRRSAYPEAMTHLMQGLEVLASLPQSAERMQHELTLYMTLGAALIATKGQAAPEVEHAYNRTRELCDQLGDTRRLFTALYGLWLFYIARAAFQTAQGVATRLFDLGQRLHSPILLVDAHRALGATLFYRGKLAPACEHVQQGIALYDAHQPTPRVSLYEAGVACLGFGAFSLWFLGYPEQALERGDRALRLAQELAHPFQLAAARFWITWLYLLRRQNQAAHEQADALIALCTAQGFPFFLALGTALQGGALMSQGQGEARIAQIRQGMAALHTTGEKVFQPYFLALLAEVHGQAGQIEEGLRLLSEALTGVRNSGECWWEAELHRLQGELLLRQTTPDEHQVAICLHRALDVARQQQAKSLELRAATSLARLWQSQDKHQEAYDLLAPVYEWFTEGLDTADLKEAKALLNELL